VAADQWPVAVPLMYIARRYHIDESTGSFDMLKVRCSHCRLPFWVLGLWMVRRGKSARCPYCGRRSAKPKKEQP
jgi:rubrerythrin